MAKEYVYAINIVNIQTYFITLQNAALGWRG